MSVVNSKQMLFCFFFSDLGRFEHLYRNENKWKLHHCDHPKGIKENNERVRTARLKKRERQRKKNTINTYVYLEWRRKRNVTFQMVPSNLGNIFSYFVWLQIPDLGFESRPQV